MPISRARAAAVVFVAVGLLLATGCSATPGSSDGAGGDASSTAFPVDVAHEYGTTRIDRAPTRVVVVGYLEHETVLALGVTPVGIFDWLQEEPRQKWPWVRDLWGGPPPPSVGTGGSPLNVEQIASLQPDLILGVSQLDSILTRNLYDKLSRIAPTVAQPPEAGDAGVSGARVTEIVGQALGKPDEARAKTAEVEARLADARRANPQWASRSAVFVDAFQAPEAYGVYSPTDQRGRFLAGLGFRPDPELTALAKDSFSATVAQENTGQLDADWLFVSASPAKQAQLRTDPLFQALPATRANRVVFVTVQDEPYIGAALSYGTVLSLPYATDRVVDLLRGR